MRLQIALEYMIIFAFVLVVFLFLFALIASQRAQTLGNQLFGQEQLAAQNIASQLSTAMQAGNGYTASVPISSLMGTLSYQLLVGKNGAVLLNASVGKQSIQAIAYSGVQQVESSSQYLQANSFYYNLPTANGTLHIQNSFGTICVDYQCPNTSSTPSNVSLSSENVHAAQFNGQSSYIAIPNSNSLNPTPSATAVLWIYPKQKQSGNSRLIGKGIGLLYVSYIASSVTAGNLGIGNTNNVSITANAWHQIVATYSGNVISLYIDGSLSASTTVSSDLSTNKQPLQIGSMTPTFDSGVYFNGSIANTQLYNTTLSAQQVQQLYQEGIAGTPLSSAGLVGWWPLNGNANDYSGNGNNGVIGGPLLFPSVSELFAKVTNQAGSAITNTLVGFTTTMGSFVGSNAFATNYTDTRGIAATFLNQQGNNGQALVKATAFNGNSSLTGNLVGWWPMNLGQGNATYDLSGNGNTGSMHSAAGWSNPNYVASFRGPSQPQIALNPFGTTQCSFTSSAWVEETGIAPPGLGRVFIFIEYNAGGTQVWDQININDAGLQVALFNNSRGESPVTIPLALSPKNRWTFILTGSNSTNSFAYVNGVQVYNGNSVGCMNTNTAQAIGGPGVGWFNGSITNVQFYNAALAPSQIRALYQEGTGAAPIISGNIIGWWPLDGNANDYSGNGNNGTIYGNVGFVKSPTATNLNGNATSILAGNFNGASSNVSTALPTTATASVSIAVWAYVPSTSEHGAFVKLGSTGSPGTGYGIGVGAGNWDSAGNELLVLFENVRWIDCGTSMGTGWHLAVLVLSSGGVPSCYLDGRITATSIGANAIAPTPAMYIGSDGAFSTRFFTGSLANAQVYNTALSTQQVQQLYQEGIAGTPLSSAGLVGWWPLNGNANDYSSNGNNGTASNVIYSPQRVTQPLQATTFGGSGVNFNGNGGYISSANTKTLSGPNVTNQVTASAWVNLPIWPGNEIIDDSGAGRFQLAVYGPNAGFEASPFGPWIKSGPYKLLTNTWYMLSVTAVFNPVSNTATDVLYLDGVAVNSTTLGNAGPIWPKLVSMAAIGANCYLCTEANIANAQIYDRVLTSSQMEQLYNAQTPPSASATIPLSWSP